MANRSCIFFIDFDSTNESREATKKACSLSEWGFSITLSYMMLASSDAKLANSIIWEY